MVSDAHLHFHGHHWNETFPRDGTQPSVTVECGVALYPEHAETYYIFDNDSTREGCHYGDNISYGEDADDFIRRLAAQLDKAAEAAWDDDISTCEECGYHQHAVDPHQHED